MKTMRVVLMLFVVAFVAASLWLIVGLLGGGDEPTLPSSSSSSAGQGTTTTSSATGSIASSGTSSTGLTSSPGSSSGSDPASSSGSGSSGSPSSSSASTSQSSTSSKPSSSASGSSSSGEYVNLTLVNKWNYLPENFEPNVEVIGNFSSYRFDAKAVQHLRDFYAAAKAAGYTLVVNSAYRSVAKQKELYENKVQYHVDRGMSLEAAKEEALKRVLYPGSSEHNLGLSADLLDSKWGGGLTPEFSGTKCYEWMRANCHKYGFILRYPDDKQDITGVDFEPWHYRYVGVTAATEIMQQGVCLEEYLGKVQS